MATIRQYSRKPLALAVMFSAASVAMVNATFAADVPLNEPVSLRVTTPGFTDRYLRHFRGDAVTSSYDGAFTTAQLGDAEFKLVPGLADPQCVSFLANNIPDAYIRHWWGDVSVQRYSPSDRQMANDATFCVEDGLSGKGVSFRVYNDAYRYLSHADAQIVLNDQFSNSPSFRDDATWEVADSVRTDASKILPVGEYLSLRVVTENHTNKFARHSDGVGVTSIFDTRDNNEALQDGVFKVVLGLADASCYSFESQNQPGHYLRHSNYNIRLDAEQNNQLFREDATYCATSGLAGEGLSFSSYNYPNHFLRHAYGELMISDGSDFPMAFYEDASWEVVPPVTEKTPVRYPSPGDTTGPGSLPPKIAKATYLGAQRSAYNDYARDLGFTGVLNGEIVWTYGDVLIRNDRGSFDFCSSDAVALGDIKKPMQTFETQLRGGGCTEQWVPLTDEENATGGLGRWAEGGTNIVEYAPNKGLVFFLKNDRQAGSDSIVGAGVAKVSMTANGPHADRQMDTQWNSFEPFFGDIGVTYNPLDKKVYAYGNGPAGLGEHVFLARADAERATDVSAYEYWNAATQSWTTQRFANGEWGTLKVSREQAIFKDRELGQSNAFWSNYYNTWMFVHGANLGYTDIMIKTAPKLEGPWTKSFTIASTCPTGECGAIKYAITPHPEYDPTGKTLLVSWTDDNVIHMTLIEFE